MHTRDDVVPPARRLRELTVALSRAVEPSQVIECFVDAGRSALGAASGIAWMLKDDATLELVAQQHDAASAATAERLVVFETIPISAPLPVCDVIRTTQPMLFENPQALIARYPAVTPPPSSPSRAWAVLPFVFDGRSIGAATFTFPQERAFSAEDRELLTAMTGQAALAFERSRLMEAERRARGDAERARLRERQLHIIAARLSSALTQEQISTIACQEAVAFVGAYVGFLSVREGGESVVLGEGGSPPPVDPAYARVPLTMAMPATDAIRTEQPVWCSTREELDTRYPHLVPVWQKRGVRSGGAIPFAFENRTTGAVAIAFLDERPLAPDDRAFLHAVGQLAAQALERARLFEAHRRSEERLRLALVAARAATWSVDLETGMATRDDSYRKLVGQSAARASADFMSIHADDRPIAQAAYARTLAEGVPYEPEVRVRRDDGTYMWIRGHGRLVHDASGKPIALTGVIVDIDAAKRAALLAEEERALREKSAREHQEQLELAVARAEAADRRKDEFIAMLSHELRNPLAPITTALELMTLKDGAETKERAVIRRQVEHLSRMIDDLLDVSRITRGKIQLSRQVIELGGVLAKAIEMASPLLEKRRQRLAFDVPRSGLLVDADPTRLAQVFQNLLTNAAKYSDVGAHVTLTARGDRDRVIVEVHDEGIGIVPELMPRLFDLFVQGERALDRSEGGLGIGLTIARSLCELHGGTIDATSPGSGQGSTFTVALPRVTAPGASARDTDARPDLPRAPALGAPSRVLVVDDNIDAAHMLRDILAALGHEPVVAHDGPSALELAWSFQPDVAVLDIGLPVMNGYEVARQLRERIGSDKLRLIAVTGYGQEADRTRALEVGFDHHLVKPIELDALLSLLDD